MKTKLENYPYPIVIGEIYYAAGICPFQIEGKVENLSLDVYIRYRSGRLRVYIGIIGLASLGDLVFDENIGDAFDGYASHDLFLCLSGVVIFPHGFKICGIEPRKMIALKEETEGF